MGSVIPRREKKFRARRAGFPPRAGTRDSPAGDVVSATGEDERTHTPCGERLAPPSLWGGIAATALLRRAASAASDAGSSCVGRPESIQSKGAPAAPRAAGSKEMVPPGGTREKSPGPGSSFACLKPKCAPAPHRAHGMRPHPAKIPRPKRRGLRGNMVPFPAALCAAGTPMGWTLVAPFLELPPSCAALAALANRARPAMRCRTAFPQKRRDWGSRGPFRASGRAVSIDAPGAFSLGPLQRHRLGRRSRHGPSGPRRKCGVRRREPLCGATGVYHIKGAPAALCAVGNKREWGAGKHPSWRG